MHFNLIALVFGLVSAQTSYKRPSACRPLANGIVQDCGSSTDAFQIADVILTPKVPVAGRPLDVHLLGELKKEITFGSNTSISAKYNGAQVVDFNLDICQLAVDRKFRNQCPTKPKKLDVHHALHIPAYAPAGTYAIKAHGFNQDNVRIFNITINHTSKDRSKEY